LLNLSGRCEEHHNNKAACDMASLPNSAGRTGRTARGARLASEEIQGMKRDGSQRKHARNSRKGHKARNGGPKSRAWAGLPFPPALSGPSRQAGPPARQKVIFVHGCFWHSHGCKSGLTPHSNQDFWSTKLRKNKERDIKNLEALAEMGWKALVIWQCDLRDNQSLIVKIRRFLNGRVAQA